jgi:hypothetical protein
MSYPLTAQQAKNATNTSTDGRANTWNCAAQLSASQCTTKSASGWVAVHRCGRNAAKVGRLRTQAGLHDAQALQANVADRIHLLLVQSLTRTTSTHDSLCTAKAQSLLLCGQAAELTCTSQTQLSALQACRLIGRLRLLLPCQVCGLHLHSLVECLLVQGRAKSASLACKPCVGQSLCDTLA